MPNESLIMSLAKVLAAAAWVDGEPSHDEINSVKDLLFRLSELSAQQWASLQMYIEDPVGEAERWRLVEDLRNAIRSLEDKDLAIEMLHDLMMADGQVTPEEERVAAEIEAAIESADIGVMGMFSRLLDGMTSRRSAALAGAPNREDYFEDYVKNKVYYGLRRRLDTGEAELDLQEDVLRTLALAGGVMAQVARASRGVTKQEMATMVEALKTYWHLPPEQARFVAEVAVDKTASQLDRYRLVREFADACTYEERADFLNVLFAVAAADGLASFREIEEIRKIAENLKLSHQDFITAKLKVPRDQREQ